MFAVMLLMTQLINIHQSIGSQKWQPTQAEIISWDEAGRLGAKYDAVGAALRKVILPGIFALPNLPFSYVCGNKMYAAVNYTYSLDPLGPKQSAVEVAYPIGSMTTAYYDPAAPENAVLQPGLNKHFYLNLIGSIALACLGIYWLTRRNSDNVV